MTSFEIGVFGVAAVLFTPDGRYLMQLRDDLPVVSMRGHWGLFGGVVEAGEQPGVALARELGEELHLRLEFVAEPFTQLVFDLGFAGRGIDRKIFYAIPIDEAAIARMRLGEGQRLELFELTDLLREPKVVPWDLYGVLVHARRGFITSALRRPAQG